MNSFVEICLKLRLQGPSFTQQVNRKINKWKNADKIQTFGRMKQFPISFEESTFKVYGL